MYGFIPSPTRHLETSKGIAYSLQKILNLETPQTPFLSSHISSRHKHWSFFMQTQQG